jgi:predicted nucleotidyltransferase
VDLGSTTFTDLAYNKNFAMKPSDVSKFFNPDNTTIVLGVGGSHAYGMARESSDVDLRGVCIVPRHIRDSVFKSFDQWTSTSQEGPWGDRSQSALDVLEERLGHDPMKNGPLDVVVYDIQKFTSLCAQNNPNVIELLYLEDGDVLFARDEYHKLRDNRHLFLSKKCKHTYTGYAQGQLKRIKGHRAWLLNPPAKEPTRKDFGLPEETVLPADIRNLVNEKVTKLIREWLVEDGIELTGAAQDVFRQRVRTFYASMLECKEEALDDTLYPLAAASIGVTRDVLSALKQERGYRSARRNWEAYRKWQVERNEARHELEEKYGYDTKHASHLVRLLRTGLEILQDGELRVRRRDAKELLAIRDGVWTYDELMEHTEDLQKQISAAYETTDLQQEPDFAQIDKLMMSLL